MKEYIKSRLGHPCYSLELELESREGFGHIDIAINDSIDWFCRYNQHEGEYKDWMVMFLQPGITTYDVPDDVTEIVEASQGWANGFTPFTSFDVGTRESLVATTGWAQFDLVTWVTGQLYLADVSKYLSRKYDMRLFPQQHKMKVYPSPKNEDRAVLFTVYRRQNLIELYNHILLKELMVAKAREQWGVVLTKSKMSLPGTGTINGDAILSKAEKDIEKVMDRIVKESAKPIITTG